MKIDKMEEFIFAIANNDGKLILRAFPIVKILSDGRILINNKNPLIPPEGDPLMSFISLANELFKNKGIDRDVSKDLLPGNSILISFELKDGDSVPKLIENVAHTD